MRGAVRLMSGAAALVLSATAASACPDWQAAPSFGETPLYEGGFAPNPYVRSISAGGGFDLVECRGYAFAGWVAARPDLNLDYQTSGSSTLSIAVESNTDTVLLVQGPGDKWYYNDDTAGGTTDAAIAIPQAQSGLYHVWIGTYDRRSGIPARLLVSEQ